MMDDEFTEFRAAEPVTEVDLLDLSTSISSKMNRSETYSGNSSFFSSIDETSKKPSKKRTFVFPYDLDLNSNSFLDLVTSENNSKPTAWSLMENIAGLDKLAKELIENGRLSQGLKCKKHSETVGEIIRIKEIKRIAAEREDYDTAIQYRNLLNQLEKQLCSANEIEEWLKEYKETTLEDLENSLKVTVGEEAAHDFKEKFFFPEIKKSIDIENAQIVMNNAQHFILVKKLMKDQLPVFIQQTQIVLQKVNEELSKAITILYKLKPHFSELSEDQDLQTYTKALPEVYLIGLKLSRIISYCNLTKDFKELLGEITHNWEECREFLKCSYSDPRHESQENVCGICLFSSKGLVMLCSTYFHVACINFWINRITTEPPKFVNCN